MLGQSLSIPRLTVTSRPLELGSRKFRGSGENELEPEGTCSRRRCESPRRRFASFAAVGKGGRLQGETLQDTARRVVAPYGRHGPRRAGGAETRPYNISGKSQQNRTAGGQAPPVRARKTEAHPGLRSPPAHSAEII